MAILLTCNRLTKTFDTEPLFRDLSLGLFEGERTGLVGLNGSGKSTFLKILAGVQMADDGEIVTRRGLRVGYVPQHEEFNPDATPIEILTDTLNAQFPHEADDVAFAVAREAKIATELDRAKLNDFADRKISMLSGGERKRLSIVKAISLEPDLLLLDEPTNHLDIEGVLWLERLLGNSRFAWLVVTHDRYLLENVTSRVIEIGPQFPDGIFSSTGQYSDFLEKRIEFLESQKKREEVLANRARREMMWLRRGVRGRGTKGHDRIKRAEKLFSELGEVKRRNTAGAGAKIVFDSNDFGGNTLIELEGVAKGFGGPPLFGNLTFDITPGMKLSLVGKNGSGKSTFIKVLTGELPQDSGHIKRAKRLKIAKFDQNRDSLDMTSSVRDALAPDADHVMFAGRKMHISAWAKRFLFTPHHLRREVHTLSGGEQARLIMARMMSESADLLILDEPTNDLDIATLEVLEESLRDFAGAVVLVTHDRYLLDNVSAGSILSLHGDGRTHWCVDFADWEEREKEYQRASRRAANQNAKALRKNTKTAQPKKKKLSYKEQREFDGLEKMILNAEAELSELTERINASEVINNPALMNEVCTKMHEVEVEVERLYNRWAELGARA